MYIHNIFFSSIGAWLGYAWQLERNISVYYFFSPSFCRETIIEIHIKTSDHYLYFSFFVMHLVRLSYLDFHRIISIVLINIYSSYVMLYFVFMISALVSSVNRRTRSAGKKYDSSAL